MEGAMFPGLMNAVYFALRTILGLAPFRNCCRDDSEACFTPNLQIGCKPLGGGSYGSGQPAPLRVVAP